MNLFCSSQRATAMTALHTTWQHCSALFNTVQHCFNTAQNTNSAQLRTVLLGSPTHCLCTGLLILNPVHSFCTLTFRTSEDLAAVYCVYRDISTVQCVHCSHTCKTILNTTQLRFSMENAMDAQKQHILALKQRWLVHSSVHMWMCKSSLLQKQHLH